VEDSISATFCRAACQLKGHPSHRENQYTISNNIKKSEMNQPVPDATEHSHQSLIEIMKADAARQEPLTSVIGAMLEETVLRNDLKQKQSSLPAFTGRRPPLSASAFVAR
jgi:hypothetical protein